MNITIVKQPIKAFADCKIDINLPWYKRIAEVAYWMSQHLPDTAVPLNVLTKVIDGGRFIPQMRDQRVRRVRSTIGRAREYLRQTHNMWIDFKEDHISVLVESDAIFENPLEKKRAQLVRAAQKFDEVGTMIDPQQLTTENRRDFNERFKPALREARTSLRPGGALFASIPTPPALPEAKKTDSK